VTKSIQQLEEAVGVSLMHRTVHGGESTLAGRALITRARTIENGLREARNDIDTILGAGSGVVRVAASPTVVTSNLLRDTVAPAMRIDHRFARYRMQ
jgi:DNA-binding transcriptional LysR family regulator